MKALQAARRPALTQGALILPGTPLNFTYLRPPLQPFSLPTSGPVEGNTTVVVLGADGALAGGTQYLCANGGSHSSPGHGRMAG